MAEAADAQAGASALALGASVPVAEVTLLEDRGLVSRKGRVRVPAGRSRLRIEAVAPVLVDKTLAAHLRDVDGGELPEGLRVRDAKIERWRVTQDADRPDAVAELRAQVRAKEAQKSAIEHELKALDDEVAALRELELLTLKEIGEDVGWGRADGQRWEAQLDQIAARRVELGTTVAERAQARQKILRDIGDLEVLVASREHLDAHVAAAIVVELINPSGEERLVELGIDYVVPGAVWRPWHTARLEEGDEPRVEFRTEGCVWQATGEDWTDVQLVFSTERPSLGVSPPTLATDRLYAFKRGSQVEVSAREQKVHQAGLGSGAPAEKEAEDDLPGIDDGGETLELRARTRVSIPTDGRPHRVPIDGFASPAEVAWVCTPELARAVMVRSRQTNAGTRPLLAGPVDLIRRSGLVGRTSLLFVAPGERFELGWGPDSALRVWRGEKELEHERRTLSSWTRKPKKVTVKLSNLGPTRRQVEVKERVAVSEIEKVEVEFVEAAPAAKPDEDGFVTWDLELKGFAHEEVMLKWMLVVHDDVVGL